MNKYRVLYVLNSTEGGGAVESLLDMIFGLRRYIVPFIVLPGEGLASKRLMERRIKFFSIPFMNGYGPIGNYSKEDEENFYTNNYEYALQIEKIIVENKIQIVHTNSSVSNVGIFASIMADIPHIWHIRELLQEQFNCEYWDIRTKKQLFDYSSKIITISDSVKQSCISKYGLDSVFIYDGILCERFYQKIYHETDEKNGENNFILAGVISEFKGQLDAVRAFGELVERGYTNIHLYIIGEDSSGFVWILQKYIKMNHLESYISVHPFSPDLSELRKKCKYSITTSKMEALGRVTIEAMMAGNLVIGADTGGTAEIIGNDERRGLIYEQGNWMSLADMIEYALKLSDEQYYEIIKQAQQYAINTFDVISYSQKIAEVYEEVQANYVVLSDRREKMLKQLQTRYKSLKIKSTLKRENIVDIQERRLHILYKLTHQWLRLRMNGYNLSEYFSEKQIYHIAIYGMGVLGQNLYDELENSKIAIDYVIDRIPHNLSSVIRAFRPDELLPDTDAIIVTPITDGNDIKDYLCQKYSFKIIKLADIFRELAQTRF